MIEITHSLVLPCVTYTTHHSPDIEGDHGRQPSNAVASVVINVSKERFGELVAAQRRIDKDGTAQFYALADEISKSGTVRMTYEDVTRQNESGHCIGYPSVEPRDQAEKDGWQEAVGWHYDTEAEGTEGWCEAAHVAARTASKFGTVQQDDPS